ncbi:hypothetical protein [Bacillus sp. ISL-37]|uniref:hypothetical protein n=1 Tax=Bacillus sp. ISL-37 TaxID=2819123 RepID=UPI001BE95ED2|nr:hypothetical protein [Bacillus sp. ISL-37]MBT2684890.1 hypothetical protein [Bacillus sp. ISL-37]
MLKGHQILGTDKPIYYKKYEGHLFYEDLLLMGENPGDYEIAGYVQVIKTGEPFFLPVYQLLVSEVKKNAKVLPFNLKQVTFNDMIKVT